MPQFCSSSLIPDTPADLADMNILIWGVGSHGGAIADALYLHNHGAIIHLLDSKAPEDLADAAAIATGHQWPWFQGDASHPILHDLDMIVVSPAIPPRALPQDTALLKKICSNMMLFCHWRENAGRQNTATQGPAQTIAISGTKGKTSTAQASAAFLQWPCAGNSHGSVLQALDTHGMNSNFVIEISSFQLWYLRDFSVRFSCAILTNIDQDHLDWHPTLEDYQGCKRWLAQHCDYLVDGKRIHDQPTLCGNASPHMQNNILMAADAALHYGATREDILKAIPLLAQLPHRQDIVHRCEGFTFINDSAATCPQAVIAAIDAIPEPRVFILGGHNKGGDFSRLASIIKEKNIRCILLGQAAADLIAADIHGPICESLEAAMETAIQCLDATNSGHVILSPGCASFGMFRDCAERGQRFTTFAQQRWPAPGLL